MDPRSRDSASRLLLALCLVAVTPACVAIHRWNKKQTQEHREIELADVAKSWCQTIRASQVIPVYPLTEDLQPGDVFLVTRTIESQAEEYKEKGFLPLDYHLMRLDPEGYGRFYSHSVLANGTEATPSATVAIGDGKQDPPRIPAEWMRPGGTLASDSSSLKSWTMAPRAAFPSYSFSIEAGAGFNLAVPVQGVPVGLGLLGNQAASGTITISDARTLGIDMLSMWFQLHTAMESAKDEFRAYASTPEKPAYVRVVTRVYLAGAMDVSISSSSSAGGGLDVGAARPVQLLTQGPPEQGRAQAATTEQYKTNLEAINEMLAADSSRPGGSLRVTIAGGNTVGLKDSFDPPLVVGYLGFDCEVLPGGVPGPPVPTLVTLTDEKAAKALFAADPVAAAYHRAMLADGLALLRSALGGDGLTVDLTRSGESVVRDFDDLDALIEATTPVYSRDRSQVGGVEVLLRETFADRPESTQGAGYPRFKAYRRALEASLSAIDTVADMESFRVRQGRGGALGEPISLDEGAADPQLAADRARLTDALARVAAPARETAAEQDLRAWLVRFWSSPSAK